MSKKKYNIKVTKTLIKNLKPYWKDVEQACNDFYDKINEIETKMNENLEREDLEIFMPDGYPVGIGNVERTMRLIHGKELK